MAQQREFFFFFKPVLTKLSRDDIRTKRDDRNDKVSYESSSNNSIVSWEKKTETNFELTLAGLTTHSTIGLILYEESITIAPLWIMLA